MRRTDAIFLGCVLICAGLLVIRSVGLSLPLLTGEPPAGAATFGVAGQPHNVDMVKLRRLLEQRDLSDHEAEFYGPVGAPASSGVHEPGRGESPIPLGSDADGSTDAARGVQR